LKYFVSDIEQKIIRHKMDKWSMVKTYKAVLADKTLGCTMLSPSSIPGHGNNTKIGNECMYVPLRHIHVTIVAEEKQ